MFLKPKFVRNHYSGKKLYNIGPHVMLFDESYAGKLYFLQKKIAYNSVQRDSTNTFHIMMNTLAEFVALLNIDSLEVNAGFFPEYKMLPSKILAQDSPESQTTAALKCSSSKKQFKVVFSPQDHLSSPLIRRRSPYPPRQPRTS